MYNKLLGDKNNILKKLQNIAPNLSSENCREDASVIEYPNRYNGLSTICVTKSGFSITKKVEYLQPAIFKLLDLSPKDCLEDDSVIEYSNKYNAPSTICVTKISFPFTKKVEYPQPAIFQLLDPSINFLILKIENIIVSYEQLPVSYNQVMIKGALRYCAKLLCKIYDSSEIIVKVKKFVNLIDGLNQQCEVPTTFSHLDLTYIENIFESIEQEASKDGYLPKLEDMSL
ncbi:MAG: hypothetical protein A2042_05515 [Candidatus Schekmanbacteria bacterium GWA2_38_11]|uniref:Uncharacterized protein n=1 Tax=Candidatus Schekmanbacteria bacterium GWA2_38_11 TaxID=1817876 RepID=A0A1F7RHD6_9BACT|nr:MAG: hypothetical protein A2042_05515 [Candidatus Schekmanbacteria bacterium GWA2_38_11]